MSASRTNASSSHEPCLESKKDETNSDDVILIDFDRAHYGFRMWDILYFLTNYQLDFVPDHDELDEILNGQFTKNTFRSSFN